MTNSKWSKCLSLTNLWFDDNQRASTKVVSSHRLAHPCTVGSWAHFLSVCLYVRQLIRLCQIVEKVTRKNHFKGTVTLNSYVSSMIIPTAPDYLCVSTSNCRPLTLWIVDLGCNHCHGSGKSLKKWVSKDLLEPWKSEVCNWKLIHINNQVLLDDGNRIIIPQVNFQVHEIWARHGHLCPLD